MRARYFVVGIALSATLSASAFAEAGDPTETYLAYRQAYLNATGFDDIAPLLAAESVRGVPEEQKGAMFGFLQGIIRDGTGFTVLFEENAADTASVIAEVCIDGEMTGVTASLVREAGQWKVRKEHYTNSNHMVPDANDPNSMVPLTCQ